MSTLSPPVMSPVWTQSLVISSHMMGLITKALRPQPAVQSKVLTCPRTTHLWMKQNLEIGRMGNFHTAISQNIRYRMWLQRWHHETALTHCSRPRQGCSFSFALEHKVMLRLVELCCIHTVQELLSPVLTHASFVRSWSCNACLITVFKTLA